MSVVVIATITPRPEEYDSVKAALLDSIPMVHMEDGCEPYALHDMDGSLVFVEQWVSQESLDGHAVGHAVKGVQAIITDKLAVPAHVVTGSALLAGDPILGRLVTR